MAMTVTAEKVNIPSPGDVYGYLAEQRQMAASQRTVVPVTNRADGDAVATAMAADGRPVSSTNPLIALRQDTERIEAKTGNGWGGPPQGIIAARDMVAASGAIVNKAIVQNITGIEFKAGRVYKIHSSGNFYTLATASTFVIGISTCPNGDAAASTANLTGLASEAVNPNYAQEGRRYNITHMYRPQVTSTLQLKLHAERVTGSTSIIMSGATDNPIQFWVEDCGVAQGWV